MKSCLTIACLALVVGACFRAEPAPWAGPRLTQPRNQLTITELQQPDTLALLDMSFFSKPAWASEAVHGFSGAITFVDTELTFPLYREPYPGERIFPAFTIEFITHEGELIPRQKNLIITRHESESFWDVIVGTGRVWQEEEDGPWSRASFPLSLTDRYIGQSRNCVATFVFDPDTMSNVYVQCSQETADLNAGQVGNMRVMLQAEYRPETYADAATIMERHNAFISRRLPVHPLSAIDSTNAIADYFDRALYTNASTSLGAVVLDGKLYVHPPKTRHGLYPYPADMHHGVYSVTKSMAGTLALLLYFAERYGEALFDEHIADYVPALAEHTGWEGVTFSHTLNMVTGTEGSEEAEHLLNILVLASTAQEGIDNIASLGDYPGAPGEQFNYASTNLFVLSYALQNYVEHREGEGTHYWDLVHENVLTPIGAEHFALQHTLEDSTRGLPMLAYGAFPTVDETAKIALLMSNEGEYEGQQLLHREKTREVLGRTTWDGHSTGNDYRGSAYRHALWSKRIRTRGCRVETTYMLGYGANYVLLLPGDAIIIRFMDEYDLDVDGLVRRVAGAAGSCG